MSFNFPLAMIVLYLLRISFLGQLTKIYSGHCKEQKEKETDINVPKNSGIDI